MNCEICNKHIGNKGFSSHLHNNHNINSKEYYDKYMKKEDDGICLNCKNETNFNKLSKGYYKFCSQKCNSQSSYTKNKIKNTNNKRDKQDIININNKRKETCIKKYNVNNVSKLSSVIIKRKETYIRNFGVDNPNKSDEIKKKKKYIYLNKYGVDNPNKSNEIKRKKEETCLKKYGVKNPFQCEYVKNIININRDNIIKKKNKTHINNFTIKIKDMLTKYFGLELLSDYILSKENIIVKCYRCNNVFDTTYYNIYHNCGKCPNCFPRNQSYSKGEKELCEFIKLLNLEFIENDRIIIKPLELDIYIPLKNIAIEFNGLYWHSDKFKIDKNYHLNKTEECLKNNIRLIHIFEDEWIFKQEIVKSRLKQILGINNQQRIHARKCKIEEIFPKLKNEFFEKYHIQGGDRSNIKLGAFYQNELISVMTFSKGNISKGSKSEEGIYELSRFCSNSNYHIPGIASKLLTYFKRNYEWKEIFSYADRRWSDGNVYKQIGFKLDSITKPNYWYFKDDNVIRIHRFNLRKRYNEPKDIPEWVLRQKEGYHRVWDCGHLKFVLRIDNDKT